MAVKIGTDNVLKMIRPDGYKFTLDELNDKVNGYIEPIKMGLIWVMYSDTAKQDGEPLNLVASFFFDVALYGTVIVVPPHQLPGEWDMMEPEDYRFTADDIDSGFIKSLHSALKNSRDWGNTADDILNSFVTSYEEWTYHPELTEEHEFMPTFYQASFNFIISHPDKFRDNILLQDDITLVRVSPEKKEAAVNQILDYFIKTEEYEKCAQLKKVYEEYSIN